MNKEKDKTFLTPTALASRWNITLSTLSQWRWNGKSPPYLKMGKKILYDLEEIEQFEMKKIRQNTSQIDSGSQHSKISKWFSEEERES